MSSNPVFPAKFENKFEDLAKSLISEGIKASDLSQEDIQELCKARKGTPGYDQWLENYRSKRGSKPSSEGITDKTIKDIRNTRMAFRGEADDGGSYHGDEGLYHADASKLAKETGLKDHPSVKPHFEAANKSRNLAESNKGNVNQHWADTANHTHKMLDAMHEVATKQSSKEIGSTDHDTIAKNMHPEVMDQIKNNGDVNTDKFHSHWKGPTLSPTVKHDDDGNEIDHSDKWIPHEAADKFVKKLGGDSDWDMRSSDQGNMNHITVGGKGYWKPSV